MLIKNSDTFCSAYHYKTSVFIYVYIYVCQYDNPNEPPPKVISGQSSKQKGNINSFIKK